jgi:hypothetical protein
MKDDKERFNIIVAREIRASGEVLDKYSIHNVSKKDRRVLCAMVHNKKPLAVEVASDDLKATKKMLEKQKVADQAAMAAKKRKTNVVSIRPAGDGQPAMPAEFGEAMLAVMTASTEAQNRLAGAMEQFAKAMPSRAGGGSGGGGGGSGGGSGGGKSAASGS